MRRRTCKAQYFDKILIAIGSGIGAIWLYRKIMPGNILIPDVQCLFAAKPQLSIPGENRVVSNHNNNDAHLDKPLPTKPEDLVNNEIYHGYYGVSI
jgi:hypothetical protein